LEVIRQPQDAFPAAKVVLVMVQTPSIYALQTGPVFEKSPPRHAHVRDPHDRLNVTCKICFDILSSFRAGFRAHSPLFVIFKVIPLDCRQEFHWLSVLTSMGMKHGRTNREMSFANHTIELTPQPTFNRYSIAPRLCRRVSGVLSLRVIVGVLVFLWGGETRVFAKFGTGLDIRGLSLRDLRDGR